MRRVVVTGMGVVSPIGNDVPTYWDALIKGKCGIDYIARYDTDEQQVKVAAEVKGFDAARYFDPGELKRTDLYAQYAVGAATEAVENSGLTGAVAPEKIGVYVGSGIGGASTYYTEAEKMLKRGPSRISPLFIPMIISNMAAGMIAIRCQAKGPCLPVVTACATSSHAIGEAYRAIKDGHADAIIAGGAEAGIHPLIIAGFTNCIALSLRNDPLASSIPFDKRRDGFVMGEGAGILVLEELESALRRKATIHAEVVGYGNTCDAYHITAPDPEAQSSARAIKIAMAELPDISPEQIYYNAHGTSTVVNDRLETLVVKKVWGEKAYDLYISSTKSMTGHMMGAAGGAEAIGAIRVLETGIVPPTIGYEEPDPDCDLNIVPNRAIKANIRLSVSMSLGFGGHNACLIFRKWEQSYE